jgi:hypothetical protein
MELVVAERVDVVWVDDLDGSAASESVVFGLDGRRYEIDLSGENAAAFRHALAPFVAGARRRPRAVDARPGGRGRGGRPARDWADRAAVRHWARANGFEVADRGRVPEVVISAYRQRHGALAAGDAMPSSPRSGMVAFRVAPSGQPVGTRRGGVEESMTGSSSAPEEQAAPMAASPFTAEAPAVVSWKQAPLVADPFRITPPSS